MICTTRLSKEKVTCLAVLDYLDVLKSLSIHESILLRHLLGQLTMSLWIVKFLQVELKQLRVELGWIHSNVREIVESL